MSIQECQICKWLFADPDEFKTHSCMGYNKVRALEAENTRLKDAYHRSAAEIDQTLGRALGYPRYCDDQKNFPGTTDADGVCTGDHVPESLAAEAANLITRLKGELEEARYQAFRDMAKAVCLGCARGDSFDEATLFHVLAMDGLPSHQCQALVMRMQCPPAFTRTQSTPVPAEPPQVDLAEGYVANAAMANEFDPVREERGKCV
jgi:hypothetical protein